VPQTRDGSFSTDLFKRYQRSEQAFVLALMEMTVQGVSPRKSLRCAIFCNGSVRVLESIHLGGIGILSGISRM